MKIAVIGAGAMGGSLAEGLLSGTLFAPADICVANPHTDKLAPLAERGARTTTDNRTAVVGADYVVIVVKPWLVEGVIAELKPVLDYSRQTVINMAAAIQSAQLLAWLERDGATPMLFQAIPNIAIAQRTSMTFVATPNADQAHTDQVMDIFADLGKAMLVDEHLLSAGTSMAGCGIAYAMRYVRAASEGGVELGFKADEAKEIALQTMAGAVALLQATGCHPEAEIDRVTTPGGLTIRGLNAMEQAGFSNAVIQGLVCGKHK